MHEAISQQGEYATVPYTKPGSSHDTTTQDWIVEDSLAYRGPILWNLANENTFTLNPNKLTKQLMSKDYFRDFSFDSLSESTSRNRQIDNAYF